MSQKQEPERKSSKWRFGRKQSSKDKPPTEHSQRPNGSHPPENMQNHRPRNLPRPLDQHVSAQNGHHIPRSKSSRGGVPSPPQVEHPGGPNPPHGPGSPGHKQQHLTQEQLQRQAQAYKQRERAMQEMMRSLSTKDDPTKFGAGTIAARRFQREELDAAMARTMFNRELAMSYMAPRNKTATSPSEPKSPKPPKSPQSPTTAESLPSPAAAAAALAPLNHLRPAFTDEQWDIFKRDPLGYIQKHGLPQIPEEASAIEEKSNEEIDNVESLSSEFSILPPHLQLDPNHSAQDDDYTEAEKAFLMATVEPRPHTPEPHTPEPPPKKGLAVDEISSVITTFSYYDEGKSSGSKEKDKKSRVKGKRFGKGMRTTGIMSDVESNECAICLIDFEYGDTMGLLPCCHRFHSECVVDWLKRDATCPECREDLKEHIS